MDTDRYIRHLPIAARASGTSSDQVLEKFLSQRVLVTGSESALLSPGGRRIALALVNLVTRFCPRIDFAFPAGANTLASELQQFAQRIDSSRNAEFRIGPSGTDASFSVSIGAAQVRQPGCMLSAAGWRGFVAPLGSTQPPAAPNDDNPFGALISASLGAAEVFKALLQAKPGTIYSFGNASLSAWDYSVGGSSVGPGLATSLVIPPTLLGGAGAVGNALVYTISQLRGLQGTLVPVDDQSVDDSNFNRYVLVDEQDIECDKVEVVARTLRGSGIIVIPRPETIDEAVSAVSAGQIPRPQVVLSAVDNNVARRSLQLLWPDLLIQGATGDLVSRVSRHEYGSEYGCLLCIHSDADPGEPYSRAAERKSGLSAARIEAALRDASLLVNNEDVQRAPREHRPTLERHVGTTICSVLSGLERTSQAPDRPPQVAVSFVSMLAGVLQAAELVKYSMGVPSHLTTFFDIDSGMPLDRALMQGARPRPTCYCTVRADSIRRYREHVRGGSHK